MIFRSCLPSPCHGLQGTAVYGATHLADLTEKEFKENYLGFKRSVQERSLAPDDVSLCCTYKTYTKQADHAVIDDVGLLAMDSVHF